MRGVWYKPEKNGINFDLVSFAQRTHLPIRRIASDSWIKSYHWMLKCRSPLSNDTSVVMVRLWKNLSRLEGREAVPEILPPT